MHKHDTTQKPRKSSVQKLNFLEQTIMNSFRLQETWKLADEQRKATAKPLRSRFTDLLYLVMGKRRTS
jgi:hypothetical protein